MSDKSLQTKRKHRAKFCPAVIPYTAYSVIVFIVCTYAGVFDLISVYGNSNILESEPTAVSDALTLIATGLLWVAFTVQLFFRRPNFLIPLIFGMAMLFQPVIDLINRLRYHYLFYYEFEIMPSDIYFLVYAVFATAVCALFVFKTPKIKAFMKKTNLFWAILFPAILLGSLAINSTEYYLTSDFLQQQYSLMEYLSIIDPLDWISGIVFCILESAGIFLLFRWLADPYKTNHDIN